MRANRIRSILAPLLAGLLSAALLLAPPARAAVGGHAPADLAARARSSPGTAPIPAVLPTAALPTAVLPTMATTQASTRQAAVSGAPGRAGGASPPAASQPITEPQLVTAPTATRPDPLTQRLAQWPGWRLPAPLQRAGSQAPRWPDWFAGDWWASAEPWPQEGDDRSPDAAAPTIPPWRVRFLETGSGVVADRAFNAASLARASLPGLRLQVQDDPDDARRQLARLGPDQLLETTLVAWRLEHPEAGLFLNDELSLEVLRGAGPPRLSRVETLGRWRLRSDGGIDGEQWQARYGGPEQGLIASPVASEHLRLRLVPAPPGSDHAS